MSEAARNIDEPWELRLEQFKDGSGYRGWVDELEGCEIELKGVSFKEALDALRQEVAAWIETAQKDGRPLPPPTDEEVRVQPLLSWFSGSGFGIEFSEEGGQVWANLTSLESGEIVAPKYGRGSTRLEAAVRAGKRYKEEQ
jgi:predicted RNase H-like HicB family nuclease